MNTLRHYNVDSDDAVRFSEIAERRGVSASEEMRRLMRDYIAKYGSATTEATPQEKRIAELASTLARYLKLPVDELIPSHLLTEFSDIPLDELIGAIDLDLSTARSDRQRAALTKFFAGGRGHFETLRRAHGAALLSKRGSDARYETDRIRKLTPYPSGEF